MIRQTLVLVALTPEQAAKARAANGSRRRITHALICGPFGQMFGTERHCRKRFEAWRPQRGAIFPVLFGRGRETNRYRLKSYEETWNLATKLALISIALEKYEREWSTYR